MQRPLLHGPHRARFWGGLSLLAVGLTILIHHLDAGSVPRNRLFHSEAIYPAALYLDLEEWATWNTPFAPYFVPDMPLFFLCLWATGDPVAAIYGFAALQFLLLILGFYWLFGTMLVSDQPMQRLARRSVVLMGAWLVLAFACGFHGNGVFLQLFTAAFHTGSFVLTVYGLAAMITLLDLAARGESQAHARERGLLFLLFLLAFSGVLSDKLFLVVFVLPAIASLPFSATLTAARLRIAAGLSAGGLLGHLAIPWINSAGKIRIATYDPIDNAAVIDALRALPSLEPELFSFVRDRFFESLGTAYRTYWLLFVLLTLLLMFASRRWLLERKVFRGLKRLHARSRSNLSFFALFMIASFAATTLATLYASVGHYGLQVSFHGILFVTRYLISLYTIPIVAVALYLPVLLGARRASRLEVPQLAILAVLCVVQGSGLSLAAFPRFRPPDVACLDELAAERGLRHGLAFFSDARRVNVFSRRDLYVDQVTWELEPITWIASRRRPGEEAGYDFAITSRLKSRQDLDAMLGEPAGELHCPEMQILVYSPPTSPAATPRAIRNTASQSNSPPIGTSSTPRPGSPP